VAYEDFRNDIAFSERILARLTESYRKIRNTFRFILGNLGDFDPGTDAVPPGELEFLDAWALLVLKSFCVRVRQAYDTYEFHRVYHDTSYLMNVDLSAFYLDILKDRLYCEDRAGRLRRSAQTVLWTIARDACRLLAPVLSFTADEIWEHIPRRRGDPESVFLALMPGEEDMPALENEEKILGDVAKLREVRDEVNKKLEEARAARLIGQSLEACAAVRAREALHGLLREYESMLPDFFIVSRVELVASGEPGVEIRRAEGKKCARCWKYFMPVEGGAQGDICARCAGVVGRHGTGR